MPGDACYKVYTASSGQTHTTSVRKHSHTHYCLLVQSRVANYFSDLSTPEIERRPAAESQDREWR